MSLSEPLKRLASAIKSKDEDKIESAKSALPIRDAIKWSNPSLRSAAEHNVLSKVENEYAPPPTAPEGGRRRKRTGKVSRRNKKRTVRNKKH